MMRSHRYGGVVLGLFFCSGATALVYEVVWSKYLALMFGSTVQAQTVVLAVFMGGLALGNRLFGRGSDSLDRPLRAYGLIEIAIGIYAMLFPFLHRLADGVFVWLGSPLVERSATLLVLKGTLSVGLLIIPTVLMGGTLPLIASWLQRSTTDPGRRSARFYSVNSLGAVFGAAMAGFYLVQTAGLVGALQLAALVNGIIGGAAILLGREDRIEPVASSPAPRETDGLTTEPGATPLAWAGVLVAITGGVSMGLEVLSARSLVLIFGSSLQSFAMVLVAFILGIGLGSAAIASRRLRPELAERLIVLLLIGAATWIALLVFRIELWVDFYRLAKSGIARSSTGHVYHQGLTAFLSLVVLGVPAALIGAVLPLLIRATAGSTSALGRQVGRLLTWNTLGAVSGTLLTGFVLMPVVGLRWSFGVLATCLCLVALAATWTRARWQFTLLPGSAAALVLTLFILGGEGWRHVMSSGVFRAKEKEVDFTVLDQRKAHIRILFYEDAPDATVSIEQGDGVGAPNDIGLRINGKTDASSRGDLNTQMLIGHLPLLAKPEAKDVFILGLGSGITGGSVLTHPLEQLVIVENCEPVIRAAKFFEPFNRGVLTDPRTRILMEDARTILKLSPKQYDVIITQPSNPWMAGVGSVFSREYYELGANRLKPGGIMVQWFQLYDMHDLIVEMVLRTFGSVFPFVEIWDCGAGDIALLGSKEPWASAPADYARAFNREAVAADLARVGIRSVNALFARQLASQRTAFAIPGDGPVQSDLFPLLEYQAPKAFFLGVASTMLARFDERTWQLNLAPEPKLAALGLLEDNEIRPLITEYRTINQELFEHLSWRSSMPGSATPSAPSAQHYFASLPCGIGRPQTIIPQKTPPEAPDELKELLTAAAALQHPATSTPEALGRMETVLRSKATNPTWPYWPYAAIAIRANLAQGNATRARELAALGLKAAPLNRELQYLARVLSRTPHRATLKTAARRP